VHILEFCAHRIKRAVLRPKSLCIYACVLRLVSLDAKGQCACIVNVITLEIVNIITSLRADSTQTKRDRGLNSMEKEKEGSLSQGNIY
jgi:hypothetical protein